MKIVICEDEENIARFLIRGLESRGFKTVHFSDGKSALEYMHTADFDLLLLDILLPDITGWEICAEIRKMKTYHPIIILSALGQTNDVVKGLKLGADDYLSKPFKMDELEARIYAVSKRTSVAEPVQSNVEYADLKLDPQTKIIARNGVNLDLTAKEYRLLEYFMRNPEKTLSKEEILEKVWEVTFDVGTNIVNVYVNYIRKKMEAVNSKRLIHTRFGMGFILKEEE